MNNIKRVNTDGDNWYLIDSFSKTKYREHPFENYTQLPYYAHEIVSNELLCIFDLAPKQMGAYELGNFYARPINVQSGSLRWTKLKAAFEQAFPLLQMFLTYRCKTEFENSNLVITNNVTIRDFKEDQIDSVSLSLSGGAHYQIGLAKMLFEAFDVDSIASVKNEAKRRIAQKEPLPKEIETIFFFELNEWLEDSQQADFEENVMDIARDWLVADVPLEIIYKELYGRYLLGGEQLPSEDQYVARNLEFLRPYFKSEV